MAALIVDDNGARRIRLRNALSERGTASFDAKDPFDGMAALGRADFEAVIFLVGQRQLSLRGFCQLARRRHPEIKLIALCIQDADPELLAHRLGVPEVHVMRADEDYTVGLRRVYGAPAYAPNFAAAAPTVRMAAIQDSSSAEAAEAGFPAMSPTGVVPLGPDESTAPLAPAPGPGMPAPAAPPPAEPQTQPMPGPTAAGASVPGPTAPGPTAPGPAAPAAVTSGLAPSGASFSAMPTTPAPVHLMPQPVDLEELDPTAVDVRLPPDASEKSLFDGELEPAGAPVLLMTIAAQELTGRLDIDDGPMAGSFYFYSGDPVYVESANVETGLPAYLVKMGLLADGAAGPRANVETLTRKMLQAGHTAQQLHDAIRSYISSRVQGVLTSEGGEYTFYDDRTFIDALPLLRINVFGLWLVHQRGRLPPAELLRRHATLEWKYVHPTAALSSVSQKVKPFVRQTDLADKIRGKTMVKRVLSEIGYDPLMGSLLIISLTELGLVTLEDEPRADTDDVELNDATQISPVPFHMPSSEVEDTTSTEETSAREALFETYMKIKPLTDPRDVLGVGPDADLEAVRVAYAKTMGLLDEKRVPEGSAQHLMAARVEELKRKVMWAFAEVTRDLLNSGSR